MKSQYSFNLIHFKTEIDIVHTPNENNKPWRTEISIEDTLTKVHENKAKFVYLRFTDTKGKKEHITIIVHKVNVDFFEIGKIFDGFLIVEWQYINQSHMVFISNTSKTVMDLFFADQTLILDAI